MIESFVVFTFVKFKQDHKNADGSIFAELNRMPAHGDDDGMDVDVPLDINRNHEPNALRKKKRQIKVALNEIKDSLDQAFVILDQDDSDGANENDESSSKH